MRQYTSSRNCASARLIELAWGSRAAKAAQPVIQERGVRAGPIVRGSAVLCSVEP